MADYTLPDGRTVDSESYLARNDRAVRAMHLEQMRRTDTDGRRDYIARVLQSEGKECAEALKAAYLADWEKRRAGK